MGEWINPSTHCYGCDHKLGDIEHDCECNCHIRYLEGSETKNILVITVKYLPYGALSSHKPIHDDVKEALKQYRIIADEVWFRQDAHFDKDNMKIEDN